jgi:hypothetical protein
MQFGRSSSALDKRCDELDAVVGRRDGAAFQPAVVAIWKAAQDAPKPELDQALGRCCAILREVPLGMGSQLAVLCGALVELGAQPDPLIGPVADGVAAGLRHADGFRAAWHAAKAGEELPDPEEGQIEAAVQAIEPVAGEEAYSLAEGWYALGAWVMPATTLLQQSKDVRAAFPRRAELVDIAGRLLDDRADLDCLIGLLELLDDETLIVLHRATSRGYQVKINGVGDNFQLHTLLMGALSGPVEEGLLGDLKVDPRWIAVATDAPMERFEGTVAGRFNLVDAYGKWIWNEGKPADIPLLEGVRVVVLDPPPYVRGWSNIRKFPMLAGTLTVERPLSPREATSWMAKVAPQARP